MKPFLRYLALIALTVLISACASTVMPASQQANDQKMTWTQRENQTDQVRSWTISGALAMKAPQRGFTANLNWQQHRNIKNYKMSLYGPLGIGAVRITSSPSQVTLMRGNGETFKASSAQALMAKNLGWNIPVNNLYYWVRGLPAPGAASNKSFDKYHHLTRLQQSGWSIHFLRYTAVGKYDLPNKIIFRNRQLSGTLVISGWKI